MKTILAAMAVVLTSACGVDKAEAFRQGFPRADEVAINLPGANKQALTSSSTRRDRLEGDLSVFYGFTRGVTVMVNGGALAVLNLVEEITEYPATTVTQDSATWGPHTNALSPNTWKFTVTRLAPNQYSYGLSGKGKNEADSAYRIVLSGQHTSTGHKLGNGSFLIDWDVAAQLPEHDRNVGTAQFTYSKLTAGGAAQLDTQFDNVRDQDTNQLVDALYRYREEPTNGGSLEFQLDKDFVPGASIEVLTVRSRWQQTGAGRADIKLQGGDLASPATVNECWDSNFASRFLNASYDPSKNYGAETVCAFNSAQYASL